jgi:hypothetical protein
MELVIIVKDMETRRMQAKRRTLRNLATDHQWNGSHLMFKPPEYYLQT